ncbi:hypothetical protein MMPV_001433 [Pyropia vietnamensis]
MAYSTTPNTDPTLKVHPLTGERREVTGVILEAALSECAKQVKVECKGRMADALWQVVLATSKHVQAGQPSVTAAALSQALPTIRTTTSTYVNSLSKPAVAKATRKRPRRPADVGDAKALLPERVAQEQAPGTTKRPRSGDDGRLHVPPAGRHAASTKNPSASGNTAARPLDDPLRRLQARRVAEQLSRADWDTNEAEKLAGLLRQPPEDQLLVAQSVLHLVARDKNLSSSGCLAHVPQFAAWISSALEARLYGVIDALCKMLLRFDAAIIYARGRQDFIELGRLMKALVPQLAKAPQPSKPGEAETAEVRDQRTSCRSAAKDLFKHLFKYLREAKIDAPTTDLLPGASDGSLYSAPSPPSVVPTAPSSGGEVAGGGPTMAQEGAQAMERSVTSELGVGPPSAAPREPVSSLSLNGHAEAQGAEALTPTSPKVVRRRLDGKELPTVTGPESVLRAASPVSKARAPTDGDGSPDASDLDSLPRIPSVYDAITEDSGLHEYKPLTPVRGVLRSALSRRAGERTVTFGVDKLWVLPPLSPAESPARDAYEAVMDEDEDSGSGDVGLASKVRNKDVESEVKHFLARPVALDSFAVDALLTLTLKRAFEYFSNGPNFPDATPEKLEQAMRHITGTIDLAELKQV